MLEIPTTSGGRLYLQTQKTPHFYGYAWRNNDMFAIRAAERNGMRFREVAVVGRPPITTLYWLNYSVAQTTTHGFPRPNKEDLESQINRLVVAHIMEEIFDRVEEWARTPAEMYWHQVQISRTEKVSPNPLAEGWLNFESMLNYLKRSSVRSAWKMIHKEQFEGRLPIANDLEKWNVRYKVNPVVKDGSIDFFRIAD